MRKLMFITLLCLAGVAYAEVPHIFQSGQPARAADVNQNFQHLKQKTDQSITQLAIFPVDGAELDAGIAEAVCPGGSIPVSASCVCAGDGTTQNYGVLLGCRTTAVGALGACIAEGVTYNPALAWPEAVVSSMCAAAATHGGQAMGQAVGMEIKIRADEHGEAANRLSEQVSNYRAIISR